MLTFVKNVAMDAPAKLSVVVITFNESQNIRRCLISVQGIADEILVLDSFSTDDTCEIARSLGARVEQHSFDGHIEQKERACAMASHSLVLSMDADEALDDKLRSSIVEVLTKPNDIFDGYTMNRLTNYCGKWVRYSGWYPDVKLRLFQKNKGTWGGVNPHDRFQLDDMNRIMHLTGDLLHYSYYTREDHLKQIEYFSGIASNELYKQGRRVSWPLIYIKVVAQFIKTWLLKRGFLDGRTGFTIARLSAYATWRKYTKLRAHYE